jgi:hypothetical protein
VPGFDGRPLNWRSLLSLGVYGGLLPWPTAIKVWPLHVSWAMDYLHAEQLAGVQRVRVALGETAFAEAWAAGEALSADAAIEFGLEAVAELQRIFPTATAMGDQLRARAEGKRNGP